MEFKGIVSYGKNMGDIIELSAEEKVPRALQKALPDYELFKNDMLVWISDLSLSKVSFSPKGDLLKGKWQNNYYKASGTVVLGRRKLNPDRILSPQRASFSLNFEDTLSPHGLPEFIITALSLT